MSSPPHGVRRQRSPEETTGLFTLAHNADPFVTESPHSGRTVKRSRGNTADEEDPRPSTPSSPTPLRTPFPPLQLGSDTPTDPTNNQEADTNNCVSQINDLLQQALMLAVMVGPSLPAHSQHLARAQQLTRTLSSYFGVAEGLLQVQSSHASSAAFAAAATTPTSKPSVPQHTTYATAAQMPATNAQSHGKPMHEPSTRPQPSLAPSRRVNTSRPQRRRTSDIRSHRVIIRFTSPHPPLPPDGDLSGFFDLLQEGLGAQGSLICAINPTRSGNIAIHTFSSSAADRLRQHAFRIRGFVRQAFEYDGDIALEDGDSWYSVVVHNVPVRNLAGFQGRITAESYGEQFVACLVRSGNEVDQLAAHCARVTALINREELGDLTAEDPRRLSIRLDLTEESIASHLLRQGAFVGGSYCRVSRYKSRAASSSA